MAWYRRSKLAWDTCLGSKLGRYCVQVEDTLKQKGYNYNYKRWTAGLGLAGVVYATNLETIPYSKRTHLVLVPSLLEKKLLLSARYWLLKKWENWVVLPATHPASLRVKKVADKVIEAAKKGLNYDSNYLDYFEWQVLVVDHPDVVAECLPAGTIVVYRGLVEYFERDDELAAFVAHEVGHALARHNVEVYGKTVGLLKLFRHLLPRKVNNPLSIITSVLLAMRPLQRKLEREADYIGLLLMASAGYDPGAALTAHGYDPGAALTTHGYDPQYKLGSPKMSDLFSTHPSQEKTLEYLREALPEAMLLYRQSLSNPRA